MKNNDKLLEILQSEKFLAFFDFNTRTENGKSELSGLCKVALPQIDNPDYMSLTFIFDTPNEDAQEIAQTTLSKLTAETFQKTLPEVYATTSVPASMLQGENYIHQMDIIFSSPIREDVRDVLHKIVFVIRHAADFATEAPQWWDESDAPAPTEAEKANWTARIKAILGLDS